MDGTGARFPTDRDHAAIDNAIHGLERRMPQASARRRVCGAQMMWIAAIALLVTACAAGWPHAAALAMRIGLGAAFTTLIVLRIAAASIAASCPAQPVGTDASERTPGTGAEDLPVYTVLCPLYREPEVAGQLLAALGRLDYPTDRLDVKLVTEADDVDTIAALHAAGLPNWAELVVTPPEGPRTKPKALNFALTRAHGAFVCVFDAEDDPHPLQMREALAAFAAGGPRLGCVQAPLTIANGGQAWIASQFAAEYEIQFRQTLPLHARMAAPFAIGGTSNHFRMDALRACGAWDPYNVTEDADIGFRLARGGWRMTTITLPTIESAPTAAGAWIRQRTRWIKGHLQTWLVLMRDPAGAWRGMGATGFLAAQAQLGGGLLAAFAHGPLALWLAVAALSPDIEVDALSWALAGLGYASAAYGALVAAVTARDPAHLRAALTMPIYWPLASIAAARALIELIVAPHYWAKTDHTPRAAPAPECPRADVSRPDA